MSLNQLAVTRNYLMIFFKDSKMLSFFKFTQCCITTLLFRVGDLNTSTVFVSFYTPGDGKVLPEDAAAQITNKWKEIWKKNKFSFSLRVQQQTAKHRLFIVWQLFLKYVYRVQPIGLRGGM